MSETAEFAASLERAAHTHRCLVDRARATDAGNPDAVLNLVAAVVLHALFERASVFRNARYVSAELQETLEREHAELLEALGLMEELGDDAADRDDLLTLCAVVYENALHHVERDDRVIYGSLARLDAFSAGAGAES